MTRTLALVLALLQASACSDDFSSWEDTDNSGNSGTGSDNGGNDRPYELGYPGAGTSDVDREMLGAKTTCFYSTDMNGLREDEHKKGIRRYEPTLNRSGSNYPNATIQDKIELFSEIGVEAVHIRLTLKPDFVDNSYGTNSVGWIDSRNGTHTYKDLVGSDHAVMFLFDKSGTQVFTLKLDYITADSSAPSGYSCRGIWGGEGKVIQGDASAVLKASSSMDRNLNERGYASYVADSPATNAEFLPNPNAPDWDFRVVYEVWVKTAAFGAGFGSAKVDYIHASPAKNGTNTIDVDPGDCPDDWPPEDGGDSDDNGGGDNGGGCSPSDDAC